MATQQPVAKPTHPEIIKKVEKEIVRAAKDEERNLKRAVKDLSQTEKDVKKANKQAVKAEHNLEKSEKQEQTTLKNLFKAENIHDVAVSNVHRAQQNLELSNKHYGKMKETLKTKSTRVDEAMKANDENTKSRNARLEALRGPAAGEEASRVIAQPTVTTNPTASTTQPQN